MRRLYEIYEGAESRREAVPLGISWSALLLGPLWLLLQRLWLAVPAYSLPLITVFRVLYVYQAGIWAYVAALAAHNLLMALRARSLMARRCERNGLSYVATIPGTDRANALAKLAQVGGTPLAEWRPRQIVSVPDFVPSSWRGFIGVVLLTLKAAFRFRLVLVLVSLLVSAVFLLPAVLKHDGTANGFTQILLSYTLTTITALLGCATLWLACGTLARDIDDFSLLSVVVKPIPRWQIWLAKWTGIMVLNAGLIALAGTIVYGLMMARANQLSPEEQSKLHNEVLVSRVSFRSPTPDISEDVERVFKERINQPGVRELGEAFVRKQIREQLQSSLMATPPQFERPLPWVFNLGPDARKRFAGRPLYLRVRFYIPSTEYAGMNATWNLFWGIGGEGQRLVTLRNSFGSDTPTEFAIPSEQIRDDGKLYVRYGNGSTYTVLIPPENGIEILAPTGGFAGNYIRGLVIIYCWIGLLAAIGLFSASFLQFNVAAFVSLALLLVGLSGGTLKSVVEQGGIVGLDHDTGAVKEFNLVNRLAVAIYGTAHTVLEQIVGFSPVAALSAGHAITWGELARCVGLVLGVGAGGLGLIGMLVLTKREIAMPHK